MFGGSLYSGLLSNIIFFHPVFVYPKSPTRILGLDVGLNAG